MMQYEIDQLRTYVEMLTTNKDPVAVMDELLCNIYQMRLRSNPSTDILPTLIQLKADGSNSDE